MQNLCFVVNFNNLTLTNYLKSNLIDKGCDNKCNGCMNVNGEEKCHRAVNCMQLPKRSQMKVFPMEGRIEDYSMMDAVQNL